MTREEADRTLRDLLQIELGMQNEELIATLIAVEVSRDRFADLYECAPVGYLTLTDRGLIADINQAGAALLGAEPRKLLQQPFARFVSQDDADRWHLHFVSVMKSDGKLKCDLALHPREGVPAFAQLDSLRLIKDGQAPEVRVVLTDITERKQAESLRAASEGELRMANENMKLAERAANAGAYSWNFKTGETKWSDEFFRLFGLNRSSNKASYETWQAALHPDDLQKAELEIAEAIRDRKPFVQEYRVALPGGGTRWISGHGDQGYDDTGQPQSLVGFCIDITERKRAEQQRLHDEALLRSSIDAIDEAIVIFDSADRLLFYNEKYCDLYPATIPGLKIGRTFEEIIRYAIRQGKHPEAIGREEEWIANRLAVHRQSKTEFVQQLADGRWLKIRERRTSSGNTVGIHIDVTDMQLMNDALQKARKLEVEVGSDIQRSLLLGEIPEELGGAWVAGFSEPSQGIDGDFYALHKYHSNLVEILVGDVMGKGVAAALVGAGIKTSYHQVLANLLSEVRVDLPTPADIVNEMHRVLTPQFIGLSTFATLALYRFDLGVGTLTYVNAGHTPGLLARAKDSALAIIMGDNLPIGVMLEETYVQLSVAIGPGDRLLVYSDGVTEASGAKGEEFGQDRLVGHLEAARKAGLPPAMLLHSLRRELRRFSGDAAPHDDQTALLVEIPSLPSMQCCAEPCHGSCVFNLPWSLDALATLRRRVKQFAYSLPENDADALVLASFEAMTNVIRHAPPSVHGSTIACRLTCTNESRGVELIYLSDVLSPPAPVQPDLSGEREGGLGLFIIEQSVDSVEYVSPMPGVASIRLIKRASAKAV